MKQSFSKTAQTLVVHKINPNEHDLNGEVSSDEVSHGRIFRNCYPRIIEHVLILENSEGEIQGVFSLNHYFALEY